MCEGDREQVGRQSQGTKGCSPCVGQKQHCVLEIQWATAGIWISKVFWQRECVLGQCYGILLWRDNSGYQRLMIRLSLRKYQRYQPPRGFNYSPIEVVSLLPHWTAISYDIAGFINWCFAILGSSSGIFSPLCVLLMSTKLIVLLQWPNNLSWLFSLHVFICCYKLWG